MGSLEVVAAYNCMLQLAIDKYSLRWEGRRQSVVTTVRHLVLASLISSVNKVSEPELLSNYSCIELNPYSYNNNIGFY